MFLLVKKVFKVSILRTTECNMLRVHVTASLWIFFVRDDVKHSTH